MRGWVYIITTKAMPELVKVGFSTKDPELRASELNNTGNPYPYKVEYDVLVYEPRDIEQIAHGLLQRNGYHANKEWFTCSISTAISAIREAGNGKILLENCISEPCLEENISALQSTYGDVLEEHLIDEELSSPQKFVKNWLAGNTIFPVQNVQSLSLYKAYECWCAEKDEYYPVSQTAFGLSIKKVGLLKHRVSFSGLGTKKVTVYFIDGKIRTPIELNMQNSFKTFDKIVISEMKKYNLE
jgi:hypothetical protein